MDFKVAWTREFVTALQLDTKLTGIPSEVLIGALTQARDARMVVLDVIQAAIERPREQLNRLAPRVHIEQIPVAKIGELIGPKGKRINEIQSTSGAEISIEDDGRVYIGATDGDQLDIALKMIREQRNPVMPQVRERYLGTVVKTTTFGAFVSLTPFDPAAPDDYPQQLAHLPEIESCYSVAGDESYILTVRVASPRALEDLLRRIREAANVSTRTTVVLSTPYEGRPPAL